LNCGSAPLAMILNRFNRQSLNQLLTVIFGVLLPLIPNQALGSFP
jgi:hypothetical protein